jgi:putative ABC transport system permease protein
VPGVESAAIVSELPLAGTHMEHNFVMRGRPELPVGEEPEISAHEASPKYFATMQIPVIAGRVFDDNDQLKSMPVAVITRSMAEQYFHGENPIGAQIAWARAQQKQWMTIVGIVGDVRHDGLDDQAMPAVYTPLSQKQMAWKRFASVVVRTHAADPLLAANAVEGAVLRSDPQLPVTFVEPMTTVMAESLAERRFNLFLICSFAAVALALAMIGIYGVISYLVSQRTQEIGVRMALGAQRSRVVAMIMSEGLSMTAAGVLIGAVVGFALLRVGQGMLYGVTSNDPIALGGAALVLLAVAAVASFFPARRAAQIDPMNALRVD